MAAYEKPGNWIEETVDLSGHLIDSLTLSKVIDRIQQQGGDYRLNDIRIGGVKQDISSVSLTLQAPDADKMAALVEMLIPYGAAPHGKQPVVTEICAFDGEIPPAAYRVQLPVALLHNGTALPITGGGIFVIVMDSQTPVVRNAAALKAGDPVVCGTQALQW